LLIVWVNMKEQQDNVEKDALLAINKFRENKIAKKHEQKPKEFVQFSKIVLDSHQCDYPVSININNFCFYTYV
jgi:hypothetical protein